MTIQTQAPGGAWNTYPANPVSLQWNDSAGNLNVFTFDAVVNEQWDEPATVTEHPVEQGANVADHVRVQLRKCELKVWATNEPMDANTFDQATVRSATINAPGATWVPGPNAITIPTWDNQIALRSIAGSLVGLTGSLVGGALGGAKTGQIAGDVSALVGLIAADLAFPGQVVPELVQTDAGLSPPPPQTFNLQVQQWPGGAQGKDYVAMTIAALLLLKNTAQQISLIGTKDFCSPMVIENVTYVRNKDTGTGADITVNLKEVRVVATQTVAAPIPNLSAGGGVPTQSKGRQDPIDAQPQTQLSTAKYLASLVPPGTNITQLLGSLVSALAGH